MAKIKSEYKLPNPLVYQLSNPNYTIYHRAALGGLAATIQAWEKPEGVAARVEKHSVTLSWKESLTDQEFLRRILDASFKLNDEKIIDLPGQRLGANQSLQLAVHNGLTASFLQHPKMRLGEKGSRKVTLRNPDDETENIFSYKAIDSFAHQKAQKTGLFDPKRKGGLPPTGAIQQWTIPGLAGGAEEFFVATEEVILLMFLMVGSAVFMLRPRTFKEKSQSCLVIPDVIDLVGFANAISNINAETAQFQRFSHNYLGRVVGGAEEAGLQFLLDLKASAATDRSSIGGCAVVAMGKVSWDKNQINRSIMARLKNSYDEIGVFRAAKSHLGKSKAIKLKTGEDFVIPLSPIPELIAANLAADRHWCFGFKALVSEKEDFQKMRYSVGGLKAMKENIRDIEDKNIINVFQEAWRYKMRELFQRAKTEGISSERLLEVRKEKMRNDILRTKTADALASWFLQFCADSTKGGSLKSMRENHEQIRKFIFNQRNFERFQNLCLFALVSYGKDEKSEFDSDNEGEN
jgi:CRISPR-associated protein Cas8a1/Csx13